jgi:hypothetical protein
MVKIGVAIAILAIWVDLTLCLAGRPINRSVAILSITSGSLVYAIFITLVFTGHISY